MFVCVRICFCHLLLHVDSWCVCAKQVPLGGQLCGHQFIVFYGTVIYFRVSIHLIHVVQLQVSSCIYTSTLCILPSWLLHIVELTQKCRHYPIEYNMLGPPTHVSRVHRAYICTEIVCTLVWCLISLQLLKSVTLLC